MGKESFSVNSAGTTVYHMGMKRKTQFLPRTMHRNWYEMGYITKYKGYSHRFLEKKSDTTLWLWWSCNTAQSIKWNKVLISTTTWMNLILTEVSYKRIYIVSTTPLLWSSRINKFYEGKNRLVVSREWGRNWLGRIVKELSLT